MTVQQLIEALKVLPPNRDVYFVDPDAAPEEPMPKRRRDREKVWRITTAESRYFVDGATDTGHNHIAFVGLSQD